MLVYQRVYIYIYVYIYISLHTAPFFIHACCVCFTAGCGRRGHSCFPSRHLEASILQQQGQFHRHATIYFVSNGLGEPQDPVVGALERNQRTVIRDSCHHFTQLPFSSMLAAYVSQLDVDVEAIVASQAGTWRHPYCSNRASSTAMPPYISFPLLPPLTSSVSFTHEIENQELRGMHL